MGSENVKQKDTNLRGKSGVQVFCVFRCGLIRKRKNELRTSHTENLQKGRRRSLMCE